ncbi:hypothetical protein A3X38_04205 [Salmonella enterica subsp. enterica serovar Florida]|nr:hypothetical protein [Salmonella enterica subsp. enterica serovar Florida]
MKKLTVVALAGLITFGGVGTASAEQPQNTASIGYAFSHIKNFGNLNGVNLNYRYEFTPEWGAIGSFSWLKGSDTDYTDYTTKDDVNMYSLLVGPTYRLNNYVSFYGQIGVSFMHLKEKAWDYDSFGSSENTTGHNTGFAYGVGVQFNPSDNLAVTVGYEGSSFKAKENINDSFSANGFNVGVGYSF